LKEFASFTYYFQYDRQIVIKVDLVIVQKTSLRHQVYLETAKGASVPKKWKPDIFKMIHVMASLLKEVIPMMV
jgi:hypothetical protein